MLLFNDSRLSSLSLLRPFTFTTVHPSLSRVTQSFRYFENTFTLFLYIEYCFTTRTELQLESSESRISKEGRKSFKGSRFVELSRLITLAPRRILNSMDSVPATRRRVRPVDLPGARNRCTEIIREHEKIDTHAHHLRSCSICTTRDQTNKIQTWIKT